MMKKSAFHVLGIKYSLKTNKLYQSHDASSLLYLRNPLTFYEEFGTALSDPCRISGSAGEDSSVLQHTLLDQQGVTWTVSSHLKNTFNFPDT